MTKIIKIFLLLLLLKSNAIAEDPRAIELFKEVRCLVCQGQTIHESNAELAEDLKRHNSLDYINSHTLDEAYFKLADQSLEDPHLYLVISNTGSSAITNSVRMATSKSISSTKNMALSLAHDKDFGNLRDFMFEGEETDFN